MSTKQRTEGPSNNQVALGMLGCMVAIVSGIYFNWGHDQDKQIEPADTIEQKTASLPARSKTVYDTSYVGNYRVVTTQEDDWYWRTYTHMKPAVGDLFEIDSMFTLKNGQKDIEHVDLIHYIGKNAKDEDMHLEEYVTYDMPVYNEEEAMAASLAGEPDSSFVHGYKIITVPRIDGGAYPISTHDWTLESEIEGGEGVTPAIRSIDTERHGKHVKSMLNNFATAEPDTLTKKQALSGKYLQPVKIQP